MGASQNFQNSINQQQQKQQQPAPTPIPQPQQSNPGLMDILKKMVPSSTGLATRAATNFESVRKGNK